MTRDGLFRLLFRVDAALELISKESPLFGGGSEDIAASGRWQGSAVKIDLAVNTAVFGSITTNKALNHKY